MAESLDVNAEPQPETYTARLHLTPIDAKTGRVDYRSMKVSGLAEPHFKTVAEASIVDGSNGVVYDSIYDVPDLFAIDFLREGHGPITAAWLSEKDRSVYDFAQANDRQALASGLIGNWTETNLRTTHVVIGLDDANRPQFVTANKLVRKELPILPTAYMGQRLVAFMIGEGQKNKTDAFRAIIAETATHKLLPETPAPPEPRANLETVRILMRIMADHTEPSDPQLLPVTPNFFLSSYCPDGRPRPGAALRITLTDDEAAYVQSRDIDYDPKKPLSSEVQRAMGSYELEHSMLGMPSPEKRAVADSSEAEGKAFEKLESQAALAILSTQLADDTEPSLLERTDKLLEHVVVPYIPRHSSELVDGSLVSR